MPNLFKNPKFDGGTYEPKGETSLVLPVGWFAGCLDKGNIQLLEQNGCTILGKYPNHGPRNAINECLRSETLNITAIPPYLDPPRTEPGMNSVTMFKWCGTIAGWIGQVLPTTPGNTYRASFRAHAWCRLKEQPNDAHYSDGVGVGAFRALEGTPGLNDGQRNALFKVGIDPFGGKNPFGSAVVWGKGAHIYNVFDNVPALDVMARADSITVFLAQFNIYGTENSNYFFSAPSVEQVAVGADPNPPRVDYVVVAHLVPQDATKAECIQIQSAAFDNKQSVVQSADDVARLVAPGLAGSKVVVWDAERWTGGDIGAWLRARGVQEVDLRSIPKVDPPAPVPATGGSKLGAHVLKMNGDTADFIAAKPAVVKFVGDWGSAGLCRPGTVTIGRQVCDYDAQSQYVAGMSPQVAAEKFINLQKNTYLSNPAIQYWEGHNEPVWTDAEGMMWYTRFEQERLRIMSALGLKCVVGNFATGTPQEWLWPAFLPAAQDAVRYGAILGLHEYGCPWMWWMTGRYQMGDGNCVDPDDPDRIEGWTVLRYRRVYRQFLEREGLGSLPLVITEFGLDPGVNPRPDDCPGGAWRNLDGYWRKHKGDSVLDYKAQTYPQPVSVPPYSGAAQFYFEQLKWVDRELRKDPYVIGATIFTFGNFGGAWSSFDVTGDNGCAPLLTEYVIASRSEIPAPNPEPEPEPEPPPVVLYGCKSGVGMGNPQLPTQVELEALRISKVEAVKVLSLADPDENRKMIEAVRAIRPDMLIVARLFFKADAENRNKFGPKIFADTVMNGALALYAAGVTYFEVGNEPNLSDEGLGWNWADGAEYARWFNELYMILRRAMPNAWLGFPGLSPQPDALAFLQSASAAVRAADWLGVHCYWDNPGAGHWGMVSSDGGLGWKNYRSAYPAKTLMVTEFSDNNPVTSGVDKGREYVAYYNLLRQHAGGPMAAFAFALSWPGQDARNEGWVRNGKITDIPRVIGQAPWPSQ